MDCESQVMKVLRSKLKARSHEAEEKGSHRQGNMLCRDVLCRSEDGYV